MGSVYQFLKAARKNGETRRAAMSEDDEDDSSSSSSSEDDEDDEDEDTVRRKHFWRQVDVDDRYLYLAIFLHDDILFNLCRLCRLYLFLSLKKGT